jgi:hypothetical protein
LSTDAPTAFFSYSHEDLEFALRLSKDLRKAGANVWMDELDIKAGARWDIEVQNALATCPRTLVVLSPSSVKSEHVLNEIDFALDKLKPVIPVLYRHCEKPLRLRRVQHIDFRQDYARGLKALLEALGVDQAPQLVALTPREAGEESQPALKEQKSRRTSDRSKLDLEYGRSLFSRHWKFALPAGLIFAAVVGAFIFEVLGNSEVSKLAVAKAQSNPVVVQRLGEPLKRGWFTTGSVKTLGSTGHADLAIPLSGPKAKGTLYAVASENSGQWTFETLQLKVAER